MISREYKLLAVCLVLSKMGSFLFAAPPSHCKADEFSVLDAWMGKIYATEGGWRNAADGKLLSLCADKKVEPFSMVAYRYGMPGNVEFETVATASSRFSIASRQTSPHTGDDLVFFKKGTFTYYVSIAGGMGSGVGLHVYDGKKKIADHFSGNENGEDFAMGPAEIDFYSNPPASPVFVHGKPKHDF